MVAVRWLQGRFTLARIIRANVCAVVFVCTFTLTITRTFAAIIHTNNRLSINRA